MRDKKPYAEQPRLIQMMLEIRRVINQITRLEDSARRLESQKYRCTSNISGMPRGGQKQDVCDINYEIDELGGKIADLRQQLTGMLCMLDTDPDADRLTADEYAALKYKYIYDLTHEAIAETMHVSVVTVSRAVKSGYDKLLIGI